MDRMEPTGLNGIIGNEFQRPRDLPATLPAGFTHLRVWKFESNRRGAVRIENDYTAVESARPTGAATATHPYSPSLGNPLRTQENYARPGGDSGYWLVFC